MSPPVAPVSPQSSLQVRTIPSTDHLDFLRSQRSASFLQTPAWAEVKSEWQRESIGWFDEGDRLTGAGLVLYRQLPKLRRYLAYLPEGPVIDWSSDRLADWLTPMAIHLRAQGAFGIRMGPPVISRRWSADAVKRGVADEAVSRLGEVPPSDRSPLGARVVSQLDELGWRLQSVEGGFAAGQPQYNFQLPLRRDDRARSEEDLLKGMNQQWRRNIKKADKAGVEVTRVDNHDVDRDLPAFWELYRGTAERDGFTPRPLSYFSTMFRALMTEEEDRVRLYLARHEGDLVAATIWVRVGGHTWYSYGASSTHKRDVRGSNAVQWAMIRDSLGVGADVYDMRGITDTLASGDPHLGLIQFKVGTGGEAVEYVGEWDLPISSLIYKAFTVYLKRR